MATAQNHREALLDQGGARRWSFRCVLAQRPSASPAASSPAAADAALEAVLGPILDPAAVGVPYFFDSGGGGRFQLGFIHGRADQFRKLGVRTNADTPADSQRARDFGAEGIGLCRTEHMFFAEDRLPIMQRMITASTVAERNEAIAGLEPMQRSDFKALFEVMSPHPVTIRLLDPPIHEFLPTENQLVEELEQLSHLKDTLLGMNILSEAVAVMYREASMLPEVDRLADPRLVDEAIQKKQTMLKKVRALYEVNPMLGHRGVRLGLSFPEIYSMQISAILEAAVQVAEAFGVETPKVAVLSAVETVCGSGFSLGSVGNTTAESLNSTSEQLSKGTPSACCRTASASRTTSAATPPGSCPTWSRPAK